MRKIVILFIVGIMVFGHRDVVAGRKVQWQKFMNDTAKNAAGNCLKHACIIDSNDNIYVAYCLNGSTVFIGYWAVDN